MYGSANDPKPQMIPKLDRKWSRTGNDPHIGPQVIPIKNKEWHGFISEEGENIYKNYKLKNMFYHFTRNIPQLRFCSSKGIDLEKHILGL